MHKLINKCKNEWINAQMKECKNEGMHKWINARTNNMDDLKNELYELGVFMSEWLNDELMNYWINRYIKTNLDIILPNDI